MILINGVYVCHEWTDGKGGRKTAISKGKVALWFSGVSAASFLVLKIVSWVMGEGFCEPAIK